MKHRIEDRFAAMYICIFIHFLERSFFDKNWFLFLLPTKLALITVYQVSNFDTNVTGSLIMGLFRFPTCI